MIELKQDQLAFSFPDVHPAANFKIEFQRTLRIPDDGKSYPLPPGLGRFPLRHVDDYATNISPDWLEHGGVVLPMYQSEALWLRFESSMVTDRAASYPFAVKVAAGKINAVTGATWKDRLHAQPQDYLVVPRQPWLDGYCVQKGSIRQFVAMPLGAGYTAEEQITKQAEHGGLQIMVYPMKAKAFERRFPVRESRSLGSFSRPGISQSRMAPAASGMGLAAGGLMRQEIYEDEFDFADWDLDHCGRCFVHLANSITWRALTGENPPTTPPTASEYAKANLPWFEYYEDGAAALKGSKILQKLKSVATLGKAKKDVPLPENESVTPAVVVKLRSGLKKGQVREGSF